jgi:hypothetical protein
MLPMAKSHYWRKVIGTYTDHKIIFILEAVYAERKWRNIKSKVAKDQNRKVLNALKSAAKYLG